MNKKFLKVKELATYLGLSVATIYRMAQNSGFIGTEIQYNFGMEIRLNLGIKIRYNFGNHNF